MESPIPPDPYVTLGVPKDADASTIKKAYHKLALRLHPDKCVDESQKAARTDEFTKIQQAYDILGDDEKRGRYNAQVRLAELRRQNMEMRASAGARPEAKYNVRTSAPREAAYPPRGQPPRPSYEQPRPRYYEDDYEPTRGSTRKAAPADEYVYVKRPSPREKEREKVRVTVDPRDEDRRRDAKRREAEVRDARSSKYADHDDEKRRRERDYENMKRQTEAYDSYGSSTERITEERLREAQRHMDRHQRPPMARRESSRQVPLYRETAEVRRSAAPSKEKERARETRRTSPSKDERRRMAENIDPYERRVPNLATHTSSPPVMETPPPPPMASHRSYTMPADLDSKKKKAKDVSPPPAFNRTTSQPIDTMMGASSSSKRKETKARSGEDFGHASAAGSPGYSAAHSYGDERAAPHVSYTNGHRTVLREPTSSARRTSPSPSRPSKGAVKMKGLDPKAVRRTQYAYPNGAPSQPITVEPSTKSSSRRERTGERDRDYAERSRPRYFGENGVGTTDPRYDQPLPYDSNLRYSAPRQDRDFEKPPAFTRSSTFVY